MPLRTSQAKSGSGRPTTRSVFVQSRSDKIRTGGQINRNPQPALDSDITLASASSTRTLALDDYYLDYKKDVRRPDELITRISWRRLPETSASRFYKLARRKGDAITVTGVAVTLSVADGKCTKVRIALGAVAPIVFRVTLRRLDLVNEIYHLREPQRLPKVVSPDEARCLLLILTPTFRGSLQSSDQKKLLFAKLA